MPKKYSSLVDRFLRYVRIDTQSVHGADVVPSTEKQRNLGYLLMEELAALGATGVRMCDAGCVYATIPANCETSAPKVGFIAHMDTTPDVSGTDVRPHIVENYDGRDIVLNKERNIVMKTEVFGHMLDHIGEDLIVTDGTTLLGADDKAGVAEIMDLAEYLAMHPEIPHGIIKIGFTTDEEVGKGAHTFDISYFDADFAYTLDGEAVGEITAETFNAADASVSIRGVQVHPGSAKNKMLNAINVGIEFDRMIPEHERCEHSDGLEGYYHLTDFAGGVSFCSMKYLIRDFDMDRFDERKAYLRKTADFLNGRYGEGTVELSVKDSYYSMYEAVRPMPEILEHAKKAVRDEGIEPSERALRGGTDGSVLSNRGLACPNISAGYQNGHSVYEYISVQSLEVSADILRRLALSFVG